MVKKVLSAAVMVLVMCGMSSASLVNYWTFDETSGLVAADSAGAVANDGTWQNGSSTGLSWGTGMVGGAAVLAGDSGSDRYFAIGGIEMDGATQMSYSMWLKPNLTQAGSGGDGTNKGVFVTGDATVARTSTTHSGQFWGQTWASTDSGATWVSRNDNTGAIFSNAIYDGTQIEPEWVHIVWTWDGTAGDPLVSGDEEVRLYINGVLDQSIDNRNVMELIEDGNWQIGKDRHMDGRIYGGMIDDLAVWDTALNATTVEQIYLGGLQGIGANVPEPATLALLGLGGLLLRRKK